MRISDWSSDVCSSDLACRRRGGLQHETGSATDAKAEGQPGGVPENAVTKVQQGMEAGDHGRVVGVGHPLWPRLSLPFLSIVHDRTSVVKGMSVSVRVELGGRRLMKK